MKKVTITMLGLIILLNSGCGTVFGGHISDCQRTKPVAGQPSRQIRPAAFIFDCFGLVWMAVDFATGGIYKPCNSDKKASK